jgi:hypothetical protein
MACLGDVHLVAATEGLINSRVFRRELPVFSGSELCCHFVERFLYNVDVAFFRNLEM